MTNSWAVAQKSWIIQSSPLVLLHLSQINMHDHSKIYGPLSSKPLFCGWPFNQTLGSTMIYFSYLHTTIQQQYMVLFQLFFPLCTTIWQKYMVFLLFSLWCTTIGAEIKSTLICFFICAQPFDQKLGSSLIYFFICAWPFNQVIGSSFIFYFFSARSFDQKLGFTLIYFFHWHMPSYKSKPILTDV